MNLRSSLIRLAHANPELRGELIPLLKNADSKGPSIGHLGTTIGYDWRYYTEIQVYWNAPVLTIEVGHKNPAGGMDGPGGSTPFEVTEVTKVTVNGLRDIPKAVAEIKSAFRNDGVLKSYGKPTKFVWDDTPLQGLSGKNLAAVLFPETP